MAESDAADAFLASFEASPAEKPKKEGGEKEAKPVFSFDFKPPGASSVAGASTLFQNLEISAADKPAENETAAAAAEEPDPRFKELEAVKTGEENEEIVFEALSKLYKFIEKDVYGGEERTNFWKTRGKGQLKILKDKTTGVHRLLLRQEKTLKVCLNHVIAGDCTDPVEQGEKARLFVALDFADDEEKGEMWTFSLKFKTKEIADQWVAEYKKARAANKSKGDSADPPAAPAAE